MAKAKRRVNNSLNYDPTKNLGEFNDKPSQTVPDMTLPLKELIKRHTRGQTIPTLVPQFDLEDGEIDFTLPDLTKMNKFEKIELLENIRYEIKSTQEFLQGKAIERKRKEDEEKLLKAAEKEVAGKIEEEEDVK